MAGDWQKLMDDFSGHKTALVAEFDCTAEGNEDFCSEVGVQGFPTIKVSKVQSNSDKSLVLKTNMVLIDPLYPTTLVRRP